jgi:hypothetical protein
MEYKFKVEFLEPVMEFLESLDQKSREKYFTTFGNQEV